MPEVSAVLVQSKRMLDIPGNRAVNILVRALPGFKGDGLIIVLPAQAQLAVSFMAPGVGNGVGGMLWPACQLTGLFMPGTTVSVGGWAVRLSQSVICNHNMSK